MANPCGIHAQGETGSPLNLLAPEGALKPAPEPPKEELAPVPLVVALPIKGSRLPGGEGGADGHELELLLVASLLLVPRLLDKGPYAPLVAGGGGGGGIVVAVRFPPFIGNAGVKSLSSDWKFALVTLEKLSLLPLIGWIAEFEERLPKPDEPVSDEALPLPIETGLELSPEEPPLGVELPPAGGYEEPPPRLPGEVIPVPVPLPPRALPPPKAPLPLAFVPNGSGVRPAVEELEP